MTTPTEGSLLWTPSPDTIENANLTALYALVSGRTRPAFCNVYGALALVGH